VFLAFVDNDSCPVDYLNEPSGNMKAGLALDVIERLVEFLLFPVFNFN
jgi:hypothetical protein